MRLFLCATSLSLAAGSAFAAGKVPAAKAEAPKLITIGEIDGETDAKMSIVNVRLDQHPTWKTPFDLQDHGSFLQLNLPGAIVPEPGKFFDGNNPYLTKIAVFQLTPTDAGVRFFVGKDATKIKQTLSAELLGNRIMITIDNAKLEALLAAVPKPLDLVGPPAELAPGTTAESVIASTEVQHDIPAPSALLKGEVKDTKLAGGGIDLRDKLIRVSVFSAVMLGLLGITWLARPYIRRRAQAKGLLPEASIAMKTIGSLSLAARQKISLIQIGDEKILIGITPENVTFLTAIGKQAAVAAPIPMAAPQSFSRMLTDKAPSLEMRQAPVLKKLAGNDPETLSSKKFNDSLAVPEAPTQAAPVAKAENKALSGGRINVSVGEDGIKSMPPKRTKQALPPEVPEGGQKAIDDVTRMIREKLKTLRTI